MNGKDDKRIADKDDKICDGSMEQQLAERKSNHSSQSSSAGHSDEGLVSEASMPLELQNKDRELHHAACDDDGSESPTKPASGVVQAVAQDESALIQNESSSNSRKDEETVDGPVHDKTKKDRSKLRKGKWTVCSRRFADSCFCSSRAHFSRISICVAG